MARRNLLVLCLALALGMNSVVTAQSGQNGGQFCVRSFEDRNGDGQRQSNEPLLTRGVSVDLLNEQGIAVASGLLDSSPTATQGIICFQYLAPGQYSLSVSSPDLTPTTPQVITATISDGQLPTVVEFGGMRIAAAAPVSGQADAATTPDDQRTQLIRLGVSVGGALAVIVFMAVLGGLIYFIGFRARLAAAQSADVRRTTGSMQQVRSTGSLPPVQPGDTGKL
jgi:hypothetical protein